VVALCETHRREAPSVWLYIASALALPFNDIFSVLCSLQYASMSMQQQRSDILCSLCMSHIRQLTFEKDVLTEQLVDTMSQARTAAADAEATLRGVQAQVPL
jgi:hypothetical protein